MIARTSLLRTGEMPIQVVVLKYLQIYQEKNAYSLRQIQLILRFHVKLSVSASSPLVGFGKLNDNTIKGLISLLSVEQEIESIADTYELCINKYIQGSTSRQT